MFDNIAMETSARTDRIVDILEDAMQLIVSLKWAAQLGRGLSPDLEAEVTVAVDKLQAAKDRIADIQQPPRSPVITIASDTHVTVETLDAPASESRETSGTRVRLTRGVS